MGKTFLGKVKYARVMRIVKKRAVPDEEFLSLEMCILRAYRHPPGLLFSLWFKDGKPFFENCR
jgi:hypothetical protein